MSMAIGPLSLIQRVGESLGDEAYLSTGSTAYPLATSFKLLHMYAARVVQFLAPTVHREDST